MDVGRQGHVSNFVEHGKEAAADRRVGHKAQGALTELAGGNNLGFENDLPAGIWELQAVTGAHLASGTNQGGPAAQSAGRGQHHLNFPAGLLLAARIGSAAEESRGNDPAVVDNQQVAGQQKKWQIGKMPVGEGSRLPVQCEHPAGAAHLWRLLGDQLFGQVKVVVGHQASGAGVVVLGHGCTWEKYSFARWRACSSESSTAWRMAST